MKSTAAYVIGAAIGLFIVFLAANYGHAKPSRDRVDDILAGGVGR